MTFSDPGANKKTFMSAKGRPSEKHRDTMNVKVLKILRNGTI